MVFAVSDSLEHTKELGNFLEHTKELARQESLRCISHLKRLLRRRRESEGEPT